MPTQDKFDDVAKVLGHLVIGFNALEIALGGAIMRLLKQDDRTGGVFVSLSFKTKLDILRALVLFKIEGDGVRANFKDLLTQAETINAERNRYVHSEYTMVDEGDSIVSARLKDLHKYEFKYGIETNFKYMSFVDSEEMMDLANDASILADKILRFSERFNVGGA